MVISKYFLEFILYSVLGYIWESVFCTLKEHAWQNRGFLFGPVCPIYGVGAVTLAIIFRNVRLFNGGDMPALEIFLICAAGSAVLEYLTSLILEKIFKAKWWDYSKVPLNLNGRICLPASCGFGLAGIVIVKYLFPLVVSIKRGIPVAAAELVSLVLMAAFAADLALTLASLTQLLQQMSAYEEEFNEIMASRYQELEEQQIRIKNKVTEYASRMTYTQRHSLSKIKRFSLPSRDEAAKRLRISVKSVRLPRINTGRHNK